jgi:hypothetical protein
LVGHFVGNCRPASCRKNFLAASNMGVRKETAE